MPGMANKPTVTCELILLSFGLFPRQNSSSVTLMSGSCLPRRVSSSEAEAAALPAFFDGLHACSDFLASVGLTDLHSGDVP